MDPRKGKSATMDWLKDHLHHEGDECLIWPFSTMPDGRALISINRKTAYAYRVMCTLVHGEPPSPKHEAAHNCGRGNDGCVHPKHLEWKTRSQNQQDRKRHGTQAGNCNGPAGKLSQADVEEVRRLRAEGMLLREIAERFKMTESAICKVVSGASFGRPHKLVYWTAEQEASMREALIRGLTFSEVAILIGKTPGAVSGRASRLGLKSGYRHNAA